MKNNIKLTKSLLVLSCAALLTSCAKRKDNSVDQMASMGKATISGKMTARLVDTLGAAAIQYVPAGKVINAWVDTRDYVVDAGSGAYARKYYTTTTDANGTYSFSIDVSSYKSAVVNIVPSDFEADVVKKYASGPDAGKVYTERRVFKPAPVSSREVSKDQAVIADVNFN